ncbi:Hypothetical protein HVIM_00173 [Roseomonas mucosa]|uniref:DUF4238 domain-containing protein n=1 Tax=Roseomonas mucosa TaxID=207340 RepID=UPI0024C9D284|nr:DUF4238 domain-containing protein [Roseomonas mucosa]QDD92926.1 Hypothetical protein HVIM_00173 [Roseomonas mucosa]
MFERIQTGPKKHHFVPEMLIKNFSGPNGKLFYFEKHKYDKKIREKDPGQIFHREFYYASINKDGSRANILENRFSALESRATKIIDKILSSIREENLPNLRLEERDIVAQFFIYQLKRTPDFHEAIASEQDLHQRYKALVEELVKEGTATREAADAALYDSGRSIINIKVAALGRMPDRPLDVLKKRGFIYKVANRNKRFIIGSNPVVRMADQSLLSPRNELWLPISHDIAIGPGNYRDTEKVLLLKEAASVRHLNVRIAAQSRSFAGYPLELIESLARPYKN